jgi:hypothetical protein
VTQYGTCLWLLMKVVSDILLSQPGVKALYAAFCWDERLILWHFCDVKRGLECTQSRASTSCLDNSKFS